MSTTESMTDAERASVEEYQAQEAARLVREKEVEKIKAVIARMQAAEDYQFSDMALSILLNRYVAALPPIEKGFSHAILRTSISGEPIVDKAIWFLIQGSALFAKCVKEVDELNAKLDQEAAKAS